MSSNVLPPDVEGWRKSPAITRLHPAKLPQTRHSLAVSHSIDRLYCK